MKQLGHRGCVLLCALLLTNNIYGQFVLTKIADTNTAIPNGSGTFTGFTVLYGPETSQGSIAFYATGTNGQKGYYIQTNGVLFRAVDLNIAAPGGAGNFTSLSPYAYGFEGDTLFFSGSTPGQTACFLYSNGIISKLMDNNTGVPGTTNKFTGFLLTYPYDGRLAFYGVGTNTSQAGIYRFDAGVVTKIADTNDAFPGGVGRLSFTTSSAEIAQDADTAVAFYASDSSQPSRRGLFTVVSNVLSRVASTDVTVPGRAILFAEFSRKPDMSGGKVVFGGSFSGGSGVYQANLDGSGLIKVVESGSQIPGTNVNFTSIQNAAVELGTVVFTGLGPGVNGAYRLQNGTLEKIIAKPDLLDGKTVDQVLLSNQGLSGGRLALHIVFSNGSEGIYSTVVGFANTSNSGGSFNSGSLVFSPSSFQMTFTGQAGSAYRIQYLTNLTATNWTTLTNFTYTTPLVITDTGATNQQRYYRAISP